MFIIIRHSFVVFLLQFSILAFAQDEDMIDSVSTDLQTIQPSEKDSFLRVQQQRPVDGRQVSSDKLDRLKKDDDYWYANVEPEKKKPLETSPTQKGTGENKEGNKR